LNGVVKKSVTGSGTLMYNQFLRLGQEGTGGRTYNGYLRNFAVYSSVLSYAQITGIYSKTLFLPSVIANLQMWLDGADPLNTGVQPSSGAAVTTWSDKSGASNSGTGVASPTFVSGGGIALNGTSQYYTTNYTSAPTVETVFIVMKFNNNTTIQDMLGTINTPSGGRQFELYLGKLNTNNYNLVGYNLNSINAIPINTTILLDYTFGSGTTTTFYNGMQDGTATGISYTNTGKTAIGVTYATTASLSALVNGTIYEVVIYNRLLTATERQSMEGYLAWKWGLQASLPANHPYYSFAP
jgi:hypothetical protein